MSALPQPGCVCGICADALFDAALMGGVEAIAPKISEAVAPAPRRRGRPAQVRAAARRLAPRLTNNGSRICLYRGMSRTRFARYARSRRKLRLSWKTRAPWWSKPTPTSRAQRRSLQLGKFRKAHWMCVRPGCNVLFYALPSDAPHPCRRCSTPRMPLRIRCRTLRGSTMRPAWLSRPLWPKQLHVRRLESASPALLSRAWRTELTSAASFRRRSSRLEPSAPERTSARVASRPKKTYAEDDVFSDDDDFRDGGLGANARSQTRVRACSAYAVSCRPRDRRPAVWHL